MCGNRQRVMSDESVNLKSLAKKLGLSQTTVSRALNGFPEVSEQTRRRVIEAADRFNYRPSSSASSLATGKARTVGHVVPLAEHYMINPHFADFIAGAGETYSTHGYDMLIRVVPRADEERVYRELATQKRVDGVVVHGPLGRDPRIPLLQSLRLPFVVHGRSDYADNEYSWLDVNNRSAFARATEFLIDLGHERIALINGLETMNFAKRRRKGYEAGLTSRGIEPEQRYIFSQDMVEPYGYEATCRLLASPAPPTAMLVSSILPAMGVVRALAERGIRPGTDVSIIAFDDCLSFLHAGDSERRKDVPYFTAIRSSIRLAGRRAAQMLLEQIEQPGTTRSELWEADLVIGQTTGPAP